MKEGKKFKKLLIGVTAALMVMMCAVPVSAATKKFAVTINKGRAVHFMNPNISGNGIKQYTYRIQPQTAGTRYDIVYAYGGEAAALKGARTDSGDITNTTYLKDSSSSNTGIIACIKVTSGSVRLTGQYTTNKANSQVRFVYQNHDPLKKTMAIKKGKWIKLLKTKGNISTLPLIVGAKKGTVVHRQLNATAYETYTFKSSYTLCRSYKNKKLSNSYHKKYSTTIGNAKYHFMLIPQSSAGRAYTGLLTTKSGSAVYYYPYDCITVGGSAKK